MRGNGDRRQRDIAGLRGSQNDAQRYARTQRHDVGHFSLARILIGPGAARRGRPDEEKKSAALRNPGPDLEVNAPGARSRERVLVK